MIGPSVKLRIGRILIKLPSNWHSGCSGLLKPYARPRVVAGNMPDERLHGAAHALFEITKIFGLFTKHRGFIEEDEWWIVYLG
jgi:hypothetical protein